MCTTGKWETDRQTDRHTDKQRQTFEAAVEFRDLTHGGALAGAMVIRLRQARKLWIEYTQQKCGSCPKSSKCVCACLCVCLCLVCICVESASVHEWLRWECDFWECKTEDENRMLKVISHSKEIFGLQKGSNIVQHLLIASWEYPNGCFNGYKGYYII